MKMKKLLAVLCTFALVFALAIPAFASPSPSQTPIPNDAEIDYEGTIAGDEDPDLTVAVSVLFAAKKLYVNPYGLPFTIKNTTVRDGGTDAQPVNVEIQEGTTTAGWFSHTAVIKNNSTSDLPVSITVKYTLKSGGVKVVAYDVSTETPTLDDNYNCLYGAFQITDAKLQDGVISATDWVAAPASGATDTAHMKQVAVPASDNVPTEPTETGYTLVGGEEGLDDFARPIITPSYAAFRIRGGAAINADGADASDASNGSIANVWPGEDTVDMTIAFSFG